MNDELVNAFDESVGKMEAGLALEAALARYPAVAKELRPLLEIARAARPPAAYMRVPGRVRAVGRARVLAYARVLRSRSRPRLFSMPALRLALLAVIVMSVMFISAYGVVSTSAESVPGDTLYDVKRTVERVQLTLAIDPESHSHLESVFSERRRDETRTVMEQGRTVTVEFEGAIEAAQADIWIIAGFHVKVPSGLQISPTPGRTVKVIGSVQASPVVLAVHILPVETKPPPSKPAPTLAPPTDAPPELPTQPIVASSIASATPSKRSEIEFTGVIQSIDMSVWQIDDQMILITADTEIGDDLKVGQRVKVKAVRRADGTLMARHIKAEGPKHPDEVKTPKPSHKNSTPEPTKTKRPDAARPPKPKKTRNPDDHPAPEAPHAPEPNTAMPP